MKKFSKYALVSLFVLCLALCTLFYTHNNAQPQPTPTESQPPPQDPGPVIHPHLMVNGQIYWPTNTLTDGLWVRDGFDCIGEIKESVSYGEELTEDFQAYDLMEGMDVYGHSDFPEVVYVMERDRSLIFTLRESNRDLLNYDGVVYGSLVSISGWMDDAYWREIRELYGHLDVAVEEIPSDAVFLGETVFVGYGRWPRKELDSNFFEKPVSVYRDHDNPDILYVGKRENPDVLYSDNYENIFCYVPLPDQPNLDTN